MDFDSFWRSARAMLEGQNIYDTGVRAREFEPPVMDSAHLAARAARTAHGLQGVRHDLTGHSRQLTWHGQWRSCA